MAVIAQILTGLVLLIHVYIVLIETVLFKSRGRKVFAIVPERVDEIAPMFSNCADGASGGRVGCRIFGILSARCASGCAM